MYKVDILAWWCYKRKAHNGKVSFDVGLEERSMGHQKLV